MAAEISVKRVYDPPSRKDGLRVLADRLWPRGLSNEKARVELWAKALAPSDALRRRVHADPDWPENDGRWLAFVAAYEKELDADDEGATERVRLLEEILKARREGPVTLLYGAKNETRNNAAALRDWIVARA